ncbi:hypothetical protein C0J52_20675 [Blattella germanica]|nr:hypothetical protein C0J52_20675 [Blattella germanica]
MGLTDSKFNLCLYFSYMDLNCRNTADDFFTKEGRKTYVTSAAYLELIRSFTELNTAKQEEIMLAKQRYLGGLDKLLFAAEQIATMQTELSALRPQLEDAAKSAVQMLQEIEHEQDKVANTTRLVKDDEKVAKIQAAEAQELKHECEVDLQAAIPVLEDALAALNTLKPADITLVKSMKNPPAAIKTVMAAVCVMKDVKPARVRDPSTGRMVMLDEYKFRDTTSIKIVFMMNVSYEQGTSENIRRSFNILYKYINCKEEDVCINVPSVILEVWYYKYRFTDISLTIMSYYELISTVYNSLM